MFEFAFMPLALSCANNKRKFNDLFKPRLIGKFIETFFSKQVWNTQGAGQPRDMWIWQIIQKIMEKR